MLLPLLCRWLLSSQTEERHSSISFWRLLESHTFWPLSAWCRLWAEQMLRNLLATRSRRHSDIHPGFHRLCPELWMETVESKYTFTVEPVTLKRLTSDPWAYTTAGKQWAHSGNVFAVKKDSDRMSHLTYSLVWYWRFVLRSPCTCTDSKFKMRKEPSPPSLPDITKNICSKLFDVHFVK